MLITTLLMTNILTVVVAAIIVVKMHLKKIKLECDFVEEINKEKSIKVYYRYLSKVLSLDLHRLNPQKFSGEIKDIEEEIDINSISYNELYQLMISKINQRLDKVNEQWKQNTLDLHNRKSK